MGKYRKVPLESILKPPSNPAAYLLVQNQYWPIDSDNNIFIVALCYIYGPIRKTVTFYIERLGLPVPFTYITYTTVLTGDVRKKKYKLIKLKKAWIIRL